MKILRAVAMLVVVASVARAYPLEVEALPITHVQLGNGLVVILAPDATASSVAVHVRYEAGAVNDPGAAYTKWLERSLGAGSVHVKDFEARIEAAGGYTATTTTSDYFAMTDHVPAHALELVLWLEAERMAGLSDGLSRAGVARARRQVIEESRAAFSDEPYALVPREVQKRLWTTSTELAPYAVPVLGNNFGMMLQTDDDHSLAALREFARARMTPNNATLVIAGRFDAARTRKLVEKYFGWIPKRQTVTSRAKVVVRPLARAVEATVTDPLRKVVVAFRTEPFSPAIDIAAHVLAGGSNARLQRALVDAGIASEVYTEQVRQRASELRIVATPAAGVESSRVVAAIGAELAQLRTQPLSADELARAVAMLETEMMLAVENLAVRADLLSSWSEYIGEPFRVSAWTGRLRAARPVDLQQAFAHWLANSAAVTVIGEPKAER